MVAGHPIEEIDSIYALLTGFGLVYSAFNSRITSNLHNLYFEDVVAQINLHNELLNFSMPLKDAINSDFPLAANQMQFQSSDHN